MRGWYQPNAGFSDNFQACRGGVKTFAPKVPKNFQIPTLCVHADIFIVKVGAFDQSWFFFSLFS